MSHYAVLRELADAAVGNSKVLTNADNVALNAEIIRIELTTTATVGSRSVSVEIRDGSDVVLAAVALTPNVVASSSQVWYLFPGSTDGELPPFALRPSFDIRVYDTAGIDAADTLEVRAFMQGVSASAAAIG